jgi:lysophospholipase L1-like esterase
MKAWITSPLLLCCFAVAPAKEPDSKGQPVIVLAGDSTVAPDGGWGDGFARLLAPGVKCINLAKGGRSSKSYRDEGFWQKVIEEKPTWVLIQFGHNDQPGKGPARETDPETTYHDNMARYVDEAQAAGARAVLVTSLTRRNFDDQGKIKPDALAGYVQAVKALAVEKNVPMIDLNARSIELMERLGPEKAAVFDRQPKAAPKVAVPAEPTNPANPDAASPIDHTHLSPEGESKTADLVAEEVRKNVPQLGKLIAKP